MSGDGTNEILTSKEPQERPQDTQKIMVPHEPELLKKTEKPVEKAVEAPVIPAASQVDPDTWLNKNIAPIMAIMILIASFGFFTYILNFDFSGESKLKDIVILLIGIVSTLVTTVVAYYFGSSHGSSAKSRYIHKLNGK